MAEIEIIGSPDSTYVRVCRMTCEEKGVPYRLTACAPHTGDALRIHPCGRIPVLRHGKVRLFESRAIAGYIDTMFHGRKLIPAHPIRAAEVEQWISFITTTVDRTMIRSYVVPIHDAADDGTAFAGDRRERVLGHMGRQMAALDDAIGPRGCLVGRSLTLADLFLLPILDYVRREAEGRDLLARFPALTIWFDTHTRRRSWLTTVP